MASSSLEKAGVEKREDLVPVETRATYIESEGIAALPEDHRAYLLQRHGTLDLDPIPGHGDADPLNWTRWKKTTNLILVAFHAMMCTFTAAAILPAYQLIATDFNTTVQEISYLTSLQIAILGVAPLFWKPLSNRYGRRPIFLVSLICSLVCNIGCAKSPTYGSMAACRALVAFFISPAGAIGSVVVTESFFKRERARYMGVWTLMITLGVPVSPFLFGFVALRVNYRWIYYILAITNGVQLILYAFLGPETRYIRKGVDHAGSTVKEEYFNFKRIDPAPFTVTDFLGPLMLFKSASAVIPTVAYSMIFLFASVMLTVEIPQLFGPKFHFNPQQLGLQFLGVIIGSIIGEQIGGFLSDWWMKFCTRRMGHPASPETRLWLSYPGMALTIVGTAIFLVQIENAPMGKYNVTPVVGGAIAAAGNQIVTTVMVTYAVDTHPGESASIGVFITFVRQIWGFIGPFWFPDMFTGVGLVKSVGITTALMVACSILPTLYIQFGRRR